MGRCARSGLSRSSGGSALALATGAWESVCPAFSLPFAPAKQSKAKAKQRPRPGHGEQNRQVLQPSTFHKRHADLRLAKEGAPGGAAMCWRVGLWSRGFVRGRGETAEDSCRCEGVGDGRWAMRRWAEHGTVRVRLPCFGGRLLWAPGRDWLAGWLAGAAATTMGWAERSEGRRKE